MAKPWWKRLLFGSDENDGDATHVSTRWRAEAERAELRETRQGPVWRTPQGVGSLWDISRDEDRRRRHRVERRLKLAGGRG
jgi:hypothetical protein